MTPVVRVEAEFVENGVVVRLRGPSRRANWQDAASPLIWDERTYAYGPESVGPAGYAEQILKCVGQAMAEWAKVYGR